PLPPDRIRRRSPGAGPRGAPPERRRAGDRAAAFAQRPGPVRFHPGNGKAAGGGSVHRLPEDAAAPASVMQNCISAQSPVSLRFAERTPLPADAVMHQRKGAFFCVSCLPMVWRLGTPFAYYRGRRGKPNGPQKEVLIMALMTR